MYRTRFMTWLFLVLSVAFFFLGDFRAALETPLFSLGGGEAGESGWAARRMSLERYLSPEELLRLANEAAAQNDNQFVAFAVLHLPARRMQQDIFRLLDQAAAADPEWSWLVFPVAKRLAGDPGWAALAEPLEARIARWEAADPYNAVPSLLRAEFTRRLRGLDWPQESGDEAGYLAALAQQSEWLAAMDAAAAKRGYDTYLVRRFRLERQVLQERRWVHPLVLARSVASHPQPDARSLRDYTRLLVNKRAPEAEARGRRRQALAHYQSAALFADRLRLRARTPGGRILATSLQLLSYDRLASALRRGGRDGDAAQAELAAQQVLQDVERLLRRELLGRSTNYTWSVVLVNLSAALVVVFGLVTLLALVVVQRGRGAPGDRRGRRPRGFFRLMLIAHNYTPLLLFVACLALYLTYFPYAQNFSHYLTSEEPVYSLERLVANSFPLWGGAHPASLPLQNPVGDYVIYFVAGMTLLLLAAILFRRLAARR